MADATCSANNIGFNWPASWGTSGVLKIISDREFVSNGKPYPAGRVSDPIDQNFCYQSAITVTSDVATFATITLPQTDASDVQVVNGSGTPLYTAIIYSNGGNTKRQNLFSGWHLSSSLGSTFNFAAWTTDNNAPTAINPRSSWVDTDTLNRALAAIAYAPASTTQLGLIEVSATPLDTSRPIAKGDNDPLVLDAKSFASINAAVAAIGSTNAVLNVSTSMVLTGDLEIPGNIELRVILGGYISGVHTLQIDGLVTAGLFRWIGTTTTVVLNSTVTAEPIWWATPGDIPGTDVMTSAVQKALNSSAAIIQLSLRYKVGTLTLNSNSVRRIQGWGALVQAAAGANILNITNVTAGLVIDGISFEGVAGNFLTGSGNTGIDITSASNIKIQNCSFTGLRTFTVHLKGSSDITIFNNRMTGNSSGIRLYGSTQVRIIDNFLDSPQYTGFTIAIGLDSTNGHAFGNNIDVTVSRNTIRRYRNGQSILVHSGDNVTIDHNPIDEASTGISINGFQVGDVTRNITIDGNPIACTSTAGAVSGNAGISITGDPLFPVEDVTLNGNAIRNANAVVQDTGGGGIVLNNVNGITVNGGVVDGAYANSLVVADNVVGLSISGLTLQNAQTVSGLAEGIRVTGSGNKGIIQGVTLRNLFSGIRVDAENLALQIFDLSFESVTTHVHSPQNAVVEGLGFYTPAATTIDVSNGITFVVVANSAPTTITNMTGAAEGQTVTLQFSDANTTFNRANAYLAGGVNFVSSAEDTLTLVFQNTKWRQKGSSVNS